MGVSQVYLYQPPPTKLANSDPEAARQLKAVREIHPLFGIRRLADSLDWSINKTRRIYHLAGLKPPKRPKRRPVETGIKETKAPPNLLLPAAVHLAKGRYYWPQQSLAALNVWCGDFTYLPFKGGWRYLSVVIDISSRLVLGFHLSSRHRAEDVIRPLKEALAAYPAPDIFHSDQGVEYLSKAHRGVLSERGIVASCSEAGKPWQNTFIERCFGTLKDEMGILGGISDEAEFFELINATIFYYNRHRKHSSLKTTPLDYYLQLRSPTPLKTAQIA